MPDENRELKSTQELLGQGQSDLEKRLSARELTEAPETEVLLEQRRQAEIEDATNLAAQREFMGLAEPDKLEKHGKIEDTATFQETISLGNLDIAANWLIANANNEKYDARWLDHRSRELFKAARQAKNWSLAKQMVELASNQDDIAGRRKVLEQESGLLYEQI